MHTPSPAWSWFSKLLKPFYWLALKTATGKSKKTWVYGRISEENWLKSEHEKPQQCKSPLCCKGQTRVPVSRLTANPPPPGHQPHCSQPRYQSENWLQTPAGMLHIEEWIRKVRYLLRRTIKQSVTASSGAEEGRIRIPPTSSNSSMGTPGHRQADTCTSTHGKESVRFPDQGVQLQLRWTSNRNSL